MKDHSQKQEVHEQGGSRNNSPAKRVSGVAHIQRVQQLARIALLSAVALVLSFIETMIPLPFAVPGIKLGLANVAVLVTFYVLDTRSAACVALVKVLAVGFLFGSPTMLAYSAGGTVLAFLSMWLLVKGAKLGATPVSMIAAVLHNLGQLAVAALMLKTAAVFVNMAVLGVAACITGFLTGLVAQGVVQAVRVGEETKRPHIDLSNFAINPGELVVFAGANGSGKTSAALQLAGLDSSQSVVGEICEGRAGVAFQDPDDQIVALLVEDDTAFGLENRGVSRGQMQQQVAQALSAAGLVDLNARPVEQLSGGQKQRVSMAGLLALDFPVLILDEVTAMLDESARRGLFQTLDALRSSGVAVILVTQLMDEAFRADRLLLFRKGCVVAQGTPNQIRAQETLLFDCELELPEQRRTALSNPKKNITEKDSALLLDARELAFSYTEAKDATIFKDISLQLHEGELVALAGPSGCGKTTLLRCLAGELSPEQGTVTYATGISALLCDQLPERQLFAQTAWEDVAFGPRNQGLSEEEVEQRVSWALSALHLDEVVAQQTHPSQYSGGEQRRLALAGVLACNPRVLLLDEPTAGLDPCERENLMSVLHELAGQGCAVLFATHDMQLARCHASCIVDFESTQVGNGVQSVRANQTSEATSSISSTSVSRQSSHNKLGFGVYESANTFAHKLHPCTKIVFALILVIAGFAASDFASLVALAVVSVATLAVARVTPAQSLKMLKPFAWLMIFVAVFDLLFANGVLEVSLESAAFAAENVVRFACVLVGSAVLMRTTSPTALSDGVHTLLSPFARSGNGTDDLALSLGLTFRFLPVLISEFYQIKTAQTRRFARFDGSVKQRLQAYVPVLVVLFGRALRRADTLALAMVNRGYGQGNTRRTCYRTYGFGACDALTLCVACVLIVACFIV